MNNFNLGILLPLLLLIVQFSIILFASMASLRKLKILKTPYSGMEYSQVIVASGFLFGALMITTADIEALFQSYKAFQNTDSNSFSNTFSKFSQFFLVIFLSVIIFSIISFLIIRFVFSFKFTADLEEGSVPIALLITAILLGAAFMMKEVASEIVRYLIPQIINFR